ncbi:MAG: outer membrane protein assembly factor BamD [Pseudomonadales bacterium]|nr:outer membrane protein assembly factor BamD [Pseudomonadales bacterium]
MRFIAITLITIFLSACSSDETAQDDIDATELKFYQSAQDSLKSSNFQQAVSKLQLLEARFPFGRYAQQSQLEIIYAYYKSGQAESARAAADRFIRLHSQHPNIDYAYYLRGMASFEEDQSFLEQFLPLDPATRDLGAATDSFNDFYQLVSRYPNSKYAPDAQKRMIYLRNLLAQREVNIAQYYIRRGAYVAAANRGRYVFESYQETPSVPDALAVMVEAYQLMDLTELAEESLRVLTSNYPEHKTLTKDGKFKGSRSLTKGDKSLLNIITFGIFG